MNKESKGRMGRRDFLRALGAGAGAAVAPVALVEEAQAQAENNQEKTKARYKADSPDVQAYYRVNRYPK